MSAGPFALTPDGINYGYQGVPMVMPMGAQAGTTAAALSNYGQQAPQTLAPVATNGIPSVQIPGNQASTPLGANVGTLNLALGGLQALGNLWMAWENNKLAKKQFAYQKDITETNLAHQMMAYNTTLEDRIRSRAYTESGQAGGLQPGAQADNYITAHKLVRHPNGVAAA